VSRIFTFPIDANGQDFCEEIVREMISLFQVSEDEALGRINREWRNVKLIGIEHVIYHEGKRFYAKDIYFGHDSHWWKDEKNAKPQPYP
jgi:hypothetical protein